MRLLQSLALPVLAILLVVAVGCSQKQQPERLPAPTKRELLEEFRARYGTDWDQWTPEQRDELRKAMETAR
jgi:hypothetical protein